MAAVKLTGPEFIADPYPVYSRLRSTTPVVRDPEIGAWIVTSYDAVSAGLRDARFSSDRFSQTRQLLKFPGFAHLEPARLHSFLDRDPPDHTRLRGLVNKAFTPNRVVALEARIQVLVDQLIGAFPRGPFDLLAALAEPLPLIVIAELLGLPATDRERIKHWSDAVANVFSGRFEVMGTLIPDGETVFFILGAANRDSAHFPDPDSFVLTRDQSKHISFGVGPHFCIGARLARLESAVVFRTLIRQCSNIQLADQSPVYRDNFNLRGLRMLNVTI